MFSSLNSQPDELTCSWRGWSMSFVQLTSLTLFCLSLRPSLPLPDEYNTCRHQVFRSPFDYLLQTHRHISLTYWPHDYNTSLFTSLKIIIFHFFYSYIIILFSIFTSNHLNNRIVLIHSSKRDMYLEYVAFFTKVDTNVSIKNLVLTSFNYYVKSWAIIS